MDSSNKLPQLIQSITKPRNLPAEALDGLHQRSKGTLRAAATNRVDQFAVRQRLSGLEERWRIRCDNDVADALKDRLEQLHLLEQSGQYKHEPECLQLLLCLSTGRPNLDFEDDLAESRYNASEHKRNEYVELEISDESALWQTIDYTGGDSDEESIYATSSPRRTTREPHKQEHDSIVYAELLDDDIFVESSEDTATSDDSQATSEQIAQSSPSFKPVSEAVIIREAIHMFRGLPTSMFVISPGHQVYVANAVKMAHVSSQAVQGIMSSFAALGSRIVPIKAWLRTDEQSPTMRRFQTAVGRLLTAFFAKVEHSEREILYSRFESQTAMRVLEDASPDIDQLELLGSCLPAASGHDREIRLLNSLVHHISEQEAIGKPSHQLVSAFNDCFASFWRPVESWLQGENTTCEGITFVNAAREKDLPLDGLWRGLFDFSYNDNGIFDAPEFLQDYVAQLMTIGKTAYMLNKLQQRDVVQSIVVPDGWMVTASIHERHPVELFRSAIGRAIVSRLGWSQPLSKALLRHLRTHWHFHDTVLAMELVYLARVGNLNDKAYTTLFGLLDRSQHHEWQDQHILTGIFQEAFASAGHVHTPHLAASFVPTDRSTASRSRSLVQLEAVKLNLALSWPLANIVDASAVSILQRVAVLLMQVARAKDVLDQYTIYFDPYAISDTSTRRVVMSLQQRLRWFVNTFHSYLAFDILSTASLALTITSVDAAHVDDVIKNFRSAMDSLETGCLLTEDMSTTHQAIISVLDLAVVLSDHCLRDRTTLKRAPIQQDTDHDSDDEDSAEFPKRKVRPGVVSSTSDPDSAKLRELSATLHQLLVFVQAGMREASRLKSDPRLELFADNLALDLQTWDKKK